MTPFDLFLFFIAGSVGLALGLIILGVLLGAAWVLGSAFVRHFIVR